MHGSDIRRDPERWEALQQLVGSGVSFNEIRRTLGVDHRTVKRHFPEYQPFERGGGGEAAVVRETNRQLREFIRRGKIGSHKDAGFNTRGRMG
jgi:hypothetical protein